MKPDNLVTRGLRLATQNPGQLVHALWRKSYRLVSDAVGDLRFGIRTGIWKPKFGGSTGLHYGYEPVPYPTLRDIKRHMRQVQIEARTFVDLGCGHARPLYYFAADFDRLVGYEINPNIYEPAHRQLAERTQRNRQYQKLSILNSDATQNLPYDEDLVIFMYNPFGAEPMRQLSHTLLAYSHAIHLYYVNPTHADVLEAALGTTGAEFSSFLKVRYYNKKSRAGG